MIEIIPNWHPMFVHFTVAMFIVSFLAFLVAEFASSYNIKYQARLFARWNLWAGMILTIGTVAAGYFAYNTVDHDTPSHLAMTEHRNIAIITFFVFLLVTGFSIFKARKGDDEGRIFIALIVAATLLLGSTAWHGAELVYRHGLGVMSLPKSTGEGHAHEHPDGASHSHDSGKSGAKGRDSLDGGGHDSMDMGSDHDSSEGHHDDGHSH